MKRITCVRHGSMTNIDGEHFAFSSYDNMYKIDGVYVDGQGCQINEHVDEAALVKQCNIIKKALKRIEQIQKEPSCVNTYKEALSQVASSPSIGGIE